MNKTNPQTALVYAAKAPATLRAYTRHIKKYEAYCCARNMNAWPAVESSVVPYIHALVHDSKSFSTIRQAVSAIAHVADERRDPKVFAQRDIGLAIKGIRRTMRTAPKKKEPIRMEHLKEMWKGEVWRARDVRDRALICLGFFGGFRRSELAALNVDDVQFEDRGMLVWVHKSKTDQEGKGMRKAFAPNKETSLCPIHAVRSWIDDWHPQEGPLFFSLTQKDNFKLRAITAKSIAAIVKRHVARIGLDAAGYGAHSLRAGFVTESIARGANVHAIMRQTGHKRVDEVLGYYREKDAFEGNAALLL